MLQLNSECKALTALTKVPLVFLALTITLSLGAQAQHTFRGYSEFVLEISDVKCPDKSLDSFGGGCCPDGYAMGGVGVDGADLLCRKLPTRAAMTEYVQTGGNEAGGIISCHLGDYAVGDFYNRGTEFLVCGHNKDIRLGPVTTQALGPDGWHLACSQTAGAPEMLVVAASVDLGFLCSAVLGWKTPK